MLLLYCLLISFSLKDGACFLLMRIRSAHLEIIGFLWVESISTGLFSCVLKLCEKAELIISKCSWYPKGKLGVTMHFSEIIKLPFEKTL